MIIGDDWHNVFWPLRNWFVEWKSDWRDFWRQPVSQIVVRIYCAIHLLWSSLWERVFIKRLVRTNVIYTNHWGTPGRSIRSVFGMLYEPLSGCSITNCILTYTMYCTVRLSQNTAFHLLNRKLRAVNRNIRATQCIIHVRIQSVILHPLNGPYTDPFSSTWDI